MKILIIAVCPSEEVAKENGFDVDAKVHALDARVNRATGATIIHYASNIGSGMKIAVLDTGMDYNHPALSDSYAGGHDYVNSDGDPMDDNGHGTAVAGIITSNHPLSRGLADGAKIVALKVLDASGTGHMSDIVAAIYDAVDIFGVDVINLSLGTGPPDVYPGFCDADFPSLKDAIDYALSKNVIVVSAAGNFGIAGVSAPGCISSSLTVGALRSTDTPAPFTSIGRAVDISTIGINVFTTRLGGSYINVSGTSFAAPSVSAAIALLKNYYAYDLSITPVDVVNALINNAIDVHLPGYDTITGHGKMDLYEAVKVRTLILGSTTLSPGSHTSITCFEEPAHPDGNRGLITITDTSGSTFGGTIIPFTHGDHDADGNLDARFTVRTDDVYFAGLSTNAIGTYHVECKVWSKDTPGSDVFEQHPIFAQFSTSLFVVSESLIGIALPTTTSLLLLLYMRRKRDG
ncbi:MAG: S8 family serine peptidase [Candidatus Nitrosocaldus sp.]|nr:S8 family serine peptidase [Candidatus Nitrosocaldus sp.]MDW8000448.1 S8 family serine peptidase [Candidatus Nitrosocaldus sp.]